MGGYLAEVGHLAACLYFFVEPGSQRIGVRFNQTHQSIGEHHTHPCLTGRGQTPSFMTASSLVQPSTGTFPVSTVGSIVCGTVIAREIMHRDLVRRKSPKPVSRCSCEGMVNRGRIRISV